jgi:hypothetical protein
VGGYNFNRGDVSAGDKWEFDNTPTIGGIFGRLKGIVPGCEASLSYKKKVELSTASEYVFGATSKSGNFYYVAAKLVFTTYISVSGLRALNGFAHKTITSVTRKKCMCR